LNELFARLFNFPVDCSFERTNCRRVVQQRLLDIAIDAFGRRGLDGASTREIAAAAGTAMSSITYHYGGKEGLYLAAADHISGSMADSMSPALLVEIAEGDTVGARQAVHGMLGALLDKMIGPQTESWSLFIVREQMRPTAAFERLFDGPMGQMMRKLIRLVCVATGSDDDESVRIAALTLFGQVLVMRSSRASVLRLLDVETIDDALAARIRARIRANTDAILDALTAEAKETR
jgi:AcrR family transcriptional regulator